MPTVTKKDLTATTCELTIELTASEVAKFQPQAAEILSRDLFLPGFRPGKAPVALVAARLGELTVWQEAAQLAINQVLSRESKNETRALIDSLRLAVKKLAPDNETVAMATFDFWPAVVLENYKDLNLTRPEIKIAETEIDKSLDELREMRAVESKVERPVATGDKVIADIKIFLDKVPVDGGQSRGVAIIIGRDYLVPGFDKQLIGLLTGQTREFTLPYPTDHYQKNLAGKMVEFVVTAQDVLARNLPALDDALAEQFNLSDLATLRSEIGRSLEQEQARTEQDKLQGQMMAEFLQRAQIETLPSRLLEEEAHLLLHNLEHSLEERGGKWADYLASLKKTHDQFLDDLRPEAEKRLRGSLILRHIAEAENITLSEANLEQAWRHYGGQGELKGDQRRNFYQQLLIAKIWQALTAWNVAEIKD